MKTTEPNKNRIKNNSKHLLTFLLSVLFTLNINAKNFIEYDSINNSLSSEQHQLEKSLFSTVEDSTCENLDISDIDVIEIDETVEINFDTTAHLPANFNALQGMYDLDWNTIELVELEEDVDLDYNTQTYLPKDFNALKGMYDLDWSSIKIIELEEDVDLGFDTQKYLPTGFNPYEGMNNQKEVIVSLN